MTVPPRLAPAVLLLALSVLPCPSSWAGASAPAADDIACPPAPHTRDDLVALAAAGFQPARGGDESAWIVRLLACAEDADPAIRDGVVFEAWQRWLRAGRVDPEILPGLARTLMARLAGPPDDDGFRHPFAALLLSELARADRLQPFLEAGQRRDLLDLAARWLPSVRDHRAWDPVEGWRHAVAHGADLVLQVGLHPQVDADGVRRLLDALASQVAPPGHAYRHGEPERLARAAVFLHGRGLLTETQWRDWLEGVSSPAPLADWPASFGSAAGQARRHNVLAFLHALAFAMRVQHGADSAQAALLDAQLRRLHGG